MRIEQIFFARDAYISSVFVSRFFIAVLNSSEILVGWCKLTSTASFPRLIFFRILVTVSQLLNRPAKWLVKQTKYAKLSSHFSFLILTKLLFRTNLRGDYVLNGFFRSILTDRCIHRRELWVVSLKCPFSVE